MQPASFARELYRDVKCLIFESLIQRGLGAPRNVRVTFLKTV